MVVVAFLVLLSQPRQVAPELVFNKPKVNVDFKVFDSDQFKKLQPFEQMQTQFIYTAFTKEGKSVNGFISAASSDDARNILEELGLTPKEIKEVEIGRDNPFTPYYQLTAPATATK